jgi:hypothetical protein
MRDDYEDKSVEKKTKISLSPILYKRSSLKEIDREKELPPLETEIGTPWSPTSTRSSRKLSIIEGDSKSRLEPISPIGLIKGVSFKSTLVTDTEDVTAKKPPVKLKPIARSPVARPNSLKETSPPRKALKKHLRMKRKLQI